MRVRVYKNLTKGCYSMQARIDGAWRVVAHAETVRLRNVTFKVNAKGRDRVRATGRKEVHAWVVGELVAWRSHNGACPVRIVTGLNGARHYGILPSVLADIVPVIYNPHVHDGFVTRVNHAIVTSADMVQLDSLGVTITL